MSITTSLNEIFDKIPRRYSVDNVKEINSLVQAYETLLMQIEATNKYYEAGIGAYFDDITTVTQLVKNAASNKAAKKAKDDYFGEAFTTFRDSIENVKHFFDNGAHV